MVKPVVIHKQQQQQEQQQQQKQVQQQLPPMHPFFGNRRKSVSTAEPTAVKADQQGAPGIQTKVAAVVVAVAVAEDVCASGAPRSSTSPVVVPDSQPTRRTSSRLCSKRPSVDDPPSSSSTDTTDTTTTTTRTTTSMDSWGGEGAVGRNKKRHSLPNARAGPPPPPTLAPSTNAPVAVDLSGPELHPFFRKGKAPPVKSKEEILLERQQKLAQERLYSTKLASVLTSNHQHAGPSATEEPIVRTFFQQRTNTYIGESGAAGGSREVPSNSTIATTITTATPLATIPARFATAEECHVGRTLPSAMRTSDLPWKRRTLSAMCSAPWKYTIHEDAHSLHAETPETPSGNLTPDDIHDRFVQHYPESLLLQRPYQRIVQTLAASSDDKDVILPEKYRPQAVEHILTACPKDASSLNEIRNWLASFLPSSSVATSSTADSDSDDFSLSDSSDFETPEKPRRKSSITAKSQKKHGNMKKKKKKRRLSVPSAVLLHSDHPTIKTASVFALSQELGFDVFEVNCGMRRSGADLLELIGECTLSHLVHHQEHYLGQDATKRLSLILLESVDIVFPHDANFWKTLMKIISTSRRPIVMTCNGMCERGRTD